MIRIVVGGKCGACASRNGRCSRKKKKGMAGVPEKKKEWPWIDAGVSPWFMRARHESSQYFLFQVNLRFRSASWPNPNVWSRQVSRTPDITKGHSLNQKRNLASSLLALLILLFLNDTFFIKKGHVRVVAFLKCALSSTFRPCKWPTPPYVPSTSPTNISPIFAFVDSSGPADLFGYPSFFSLSERRISLGHEATPVCFLAVVYSQVPRDGVNAKGTVGARCRHSKLAERRWVAGSSRPRPATTGKWGKPQALPADSRIHGLRQHTWSCTVKMYSAVNNAKELCFPKAGRITLCYSRLLVDRRRQWPFPWPVRRRSRIRDLFRPVWKYYQYSYLDWNLKNCASKVF